MSSQTKGAVAFWIGKVSAPFVTSQKDALQNSVFLEKRCKVKGVKDGLLPLVSGEFNDRLQAGNSGKVSFA